MRHLRCSYGRSWSQRQSRVLKATFLKVSQKYKTVTTCTRWVTCSSKFRVQCLRKMKKFGRNYSIWSFSLLIVKSRQSTWTQHCKRSTDCSHTSSTTWTSIRRTYISFFQKLWTTPTSTLNSLHCVLFPTILRLLSRRIPKNSFNWSPTCAKWSKPL